MSAIGPGSIGALNLAGSLAGSQRNGAEADRIKSDAAERKFQIDQREMSAHSLDDVSETGLSADRDADGRQLHGESPEQGQTTDEMPSRPAKTLRRGQDALGERGRLLDLEA